MTADRPFKNNVIFTEEMANAARTRLRAKLASMNGHTTTPADKPVGEAQTMSFGNEDEEVNIDDLLPFTLEERDLIEQLAATVRKRMVTAEPEALRKIATLLYALERLPYATPNVALDLAFMERIDENLSYVSVELDEQSFRLSTGGSVFSPDVGSDSFSESTFEIETGGFRDGSTEAFHEWLRAFASAGSTIEIQGDDDSDLNAPAPDDGWERLENYWRSQADDVDGF